MLEARYVEAVACEPARTFLTAGMLSFVALAGRTGLLKPGMVGVNGSMIGVGGDGDGDGSISGMCLSCDIAIEPFEVPP
jgi:hypothetical protein